MSVVIEEKAGDEWIYPLDDSRKATLNEDFQRVHHARRHQAVTKRRSKKKRHKRQKNSGLLHPLIPPKQADEMHYDMIVNPEKTQVDNHHHGLEGVGGPSHAMEAFPPSSDHRIDMLDTPPPSSGEITKRRRGRERRRHRHRRHGRRSRYNETPPPSFSDSDEERPRYDHAMDIDDEGDDDDDNDEDDDSHEVFDDVYRDPQQNMFAPAQTPSNLAELQEYQRIKMLGDLYNWQQSGVNIGFPFDASMTFEQIKIIHEHAERRASKVTTVLQGRMAIHGVCTLVGMLFGSMRSHGLNVWDLSEFAQAMKDPDEMVQFNEPLLCIHRENMKNPSTGDSWWHSPYFQIAAGIALAAKEYSDEQTRRQERQQQYGPPPGSQTYVANVLMQYPQMVSQVLSQHGLKIQPSEAGGSGGGPSTSEAFPPVAPPPSVPSQRPMPPRSTPPTTTPEKVSVSHYPFKHQTTDRPDATVASLLAGTNKSGGAKAGEGGGGGGERDDNVDDDEDVVRVVFDEE